MRTLLSVPLFLVSALLLPAQTPVQGNGIPAAYVENTAGVIGGNLTVRYGSSNTPNGVAVVSISGGFTPFLFPLPQLGAGPVAMDPFDPAYQLFFFVLDGAGNGSVTVPITAAFAQPSSPPLFVDTVTFDGPVWSVSKTSRIDWMLPDSWEATAPLLTARQLHTATTLGGGPRDNITEVLLCGGATGTVVVPVPMASAELFSPLTRSTTPLPSLALPRALHRAVRLDNGLVLIAGGVTTGGVATANCEFFAPLSRTFLPAPSMNAPRSGHAMTLLDDGRVMVTGGVANWQNMLNTVQDSAELFDPSTSTWTVLPAMASKRFGHSQVKLQNGQVLVISGVDGGSNILTGHGQLPTYTPICELFDPTTLAFAPTDPLYFTGGLPVAFFGSAFSGAALLPNGSVLVTGGLAAVPVGLADAFTTAPHPMTQIWQNGTWSAGPTLPGAIAFHTQESHQNGALLFGGVMEFAGLTASAAVWFVDAVQVVTKASMTQPRGMHSTTRLADGTLLIYGGRQVPATIGDGAVYLPD